ncbi:hypothetical protein RASY3_14570 [Ruminococcus albus SY3]|uniref:Uncharacterized protein n=1 Tax=Ruminococcus albus SY3 TaxID=1341156 RepID=A0A011VVF8_RUMAL|nr:hypothetical protein [Ruminococcus albus]EXM38543.1 hypothetical protein RASY3_14570 [Ruminococcus albus SY3]
MYKVEFQGLSGKRRAIGVATTKEWCFKIINEFLVEKNYKSPYTRTWEVDDKTTKVDVGSWSEFFFITKEDSQTI